MKKWKSLFACGLVLLLTGWTMLCIPFNAYAQTWEAESTSTNIVAVVDEKFNSQMQQLFAYIFVHFIAPQQSRQHSLFCWQPVITPILLHRL